MISKTNEYALRVMVHLAAQDGKPCGTRAIAAATQVPASYLSKILLQLVKAGFMNSQRGIGGGFVMARDPADISVFDVVSAIDPLPRIRECPLGLPEHHKQLCPLHKELDGAFELVERAFRRATLAGLVESSKKRAALCDSPPKVQLGVRRAKRPSESR
ncbi:MAG: RrF2 family transcriptional regulator [Phycisphaerae bacterium]